MPLIPGRFKQVVIIVSSGRTGTKALAHHLDKVYPDVRALHEPKPSWRLRTASVKALSGRLTKDQLTRILSDARRALLQRIDRPIYVESNPYLQGFIDVLGEVFENPMVVHVVRDPRTYVRSGINFGAFRGLKRIASGFYPWWFPHPELAQPSLGKRWRDMPNPERLAWFWALVNRDLNRGRDIYGDRYLRIKFEDLFAKDGSGLDAFTDVLNLPRSPALSAEANKENVNASRKDVMPKWDLWPDDQKQMLLRHCGELMNEYGYGPTSGTGVPPVPVTVQ